MVPVEFNTYIWKIYFPKYTRGAPFLRLVKQLKQIPSSNYTRWEDIAKNIIREQYVIPAALSILEIVPEVSISQNHLTSAIKSIFDAVKDYIMEEYYKDIERRV